VTAELKDFVLGSFFTIPQVVLNSASMCAGGDSVTLTASVTGGISPLTYIWNTGATDSTIRVAPTTTTIYTVQVMGGKDVFLNWIQQQLMFFHSSLQHK